MTTHPVTILLAEDDDGHAQLVQRNLERAGLLNRFTRDSAGGLARVGMRRRI